MSRVTSWLPKMHLRQLLATVLLGLTLLTGVAFGTFGYGSPAHATSLTPEARSYQVNQGETPSRTAKESGEGLGESIKDAADNVREKLNLDQPLPHSTKAFFKQVQGEDVTVEEGAPSWKGADKVD
ncbi:hypothetical protein IQ268_01105 [Oculatella sp. LEGE 06141]|uniref:hypothetical protein n=1 Tax=Oculatella sp. LEGE 06141 TaxID=1828648 RepID=UPI0018808423|nr:hypothetical protein [Oculatella sp. LEGE 06141]MBE9177172.1 hypothetical protein [Oculatella sp. LEGE 06141]